MRTLGLLLAGVAVVNAVTINGPSVYATLAQVRVPDGITATTTVGSIFRIDDESVFDQTYTYTVTGGGTGTGIMFFKTRLFSTKSERPAGIENYTAYSWVQEPFHLVTPPHHPQGSTPKECVDLNDVCAVSFQFGTPLTLHWKITSAVGYAFFRQDDSALATHEGNILLASSTVRLVGVGQYDPVGGWTFFDNATITVTPASAAVPDARTGWLAAGGLLGIGLLKGAARR